MVALQASHGGAGKVLLEICWAVSINLAVIHLGDAYKWKWEWGGDQMDGVDSACREREREVGDEMKSKQSGLGLCSVNVVEA